MLNQMTYPKVLIFPVTYRCNARCCMCNIWNTKNKNEISLKEIEKIFSDELFAENLQSVNLTGGEPMLGKDLAQIVYTIVKNCRNLKIITLNTNGYFYDRYKELFEKIDAIRRKIRDFELLVYFSIDGLNETHDKIRGKSGFFENLMKTVELMSEVKRNYNVRYSFNFTITPYNYNEMMKTFLFLDNLNLSLDFTLSMPSDTYFNNTVSNDLWQYDNEAIYQICSMLDEMLKKKKLTYSRTYYKNLIRMLQGDERKIGCIFKKEGLFLTPDGDIYKCWADNCRIGNIYEEKIGQIWEKSFYEYDIEKLEMKCKKCYNNCYVNFQRNDAIKHLLDKINVDMG